MQQGSHTQLAAQCDSRHMATHNPRDSPKSERALFGIPPRPI